LKIAHLSVGDPFTARLVNDQAKNGHDVHLIMLKEETELLEGVEKHYLPFKPPVGYILNFIHLRRLLKKINPDILHVHYASGHGLLGRLSKFKPSILSAWGSDVMIVPKKSIFLYKIIHKNLLFYNELVVTSKAMVDDVNKNFILNKKINQIPIGIEIEKFINNKNKNKSKDLVIGTVKTMKNIYGIDNLIYSYSLLIKEIDIPTKLLIVGDGPELSNLKKLVFKLGISKLVQFLGYVENSKIPKILSEIDIFVNLSRVESFGVSVLEASSAGIPIVSSNIGGLPEVVKNNKTGYLIEVDNSVACKKKLKKLALSSHLREEMGSNGRKFVKEKYPWIFTYNRTMDLYSKLIK